MKRLFSGILVIGLCFVGFGRLQAEGKLVLVAPGIDPVPVVVFGNAPPKTRRAADELAEYIGKVSGARPEVIEGEPAPIPDSAIWVGMQAVVAGLFPDLDLEFRHPEEILIAANRNHLVIAGRDRWDPDQMSRPRFRTPRSRIGTIEGAQDEYGTANAVYTFLQEYLGVRWLWPGETGLDIIKSARIVFEPFEYRYHPPIRNRDNMFRFTSMEWSVNPDFSDWARFSRLQLDSISAGAVLQGHGFTDWWERFSDEHPEYFALQPDGTRSGFPGPRRVKMCQSNPDVWERWVDEVEKALEENPSQRVFSGEPNDSWHRGHCMCEDCQAWDHPDGELRRFAWEGVSKDYVALSDRHVTFANMLGRKLKERFSDQDLYVVTAAYGHSRPAPLEAAPDDNVIISSVANFFGLRTDLADRGAPAGTMHREQFAAWGEVAPNLMWRPNTGDPAGWRAGNPIIPLEQTMEDFRLLADVGCIGIHIDYVWLYWATQGPLYYLMAQLAWNPHADGHALMEEYFERAYGPAVETVRAYWELVEANPGLLTDELMGQALELLDQAKTEVAGAPEKYQDRVEFTRKGLEYVGLVRKGQALMNAYEESEGQDQAAAERARENWQEILRMNDEDPNLFRRGSIANRRDQPSDRLGKVHPDY